MAVIPDSVIKTALERYQFCSDSEADYRKKALGDLRMYAGEGQWDAAVQNQRNIDSRPCLVINKLPGAVRQITNGLRQNMPEIHAIPVNDSDEEVADIFGGLMRHIQDASNAGVAYSTANMGQVIAGQGFYRVVTEYCDDDTFDKEIKIKRIKNPLSVFVDPTAIEPDYSDAGYIFITYDISKKAFESSYPGKQIINNDDLATAIGDKAAAWTAVDDQHMRIAEYFTAEEKDAGTLYQLTDGTITPEKPESEDMIANQRPLRKRQVMWRMISAIEELDKEEWPGKYIPIVPVIGEDLDIDGKRCLKGMVRDATDPQRMYNYWASAQTEMIALAPKTPFIGAEGQFEGYKNQWKDANTKSFAYLPYKPTSINGTLVPPPQRQTSEPPVQAMVQAMMQASEDMKATTGIYDASLGRQGNETSGKAINARKMQGDTSNYHFIDNFARSQLYLGKILIDLIPKIYNTARIVRILGDDGVTKMVKINQPSGEKTIEGVEKIYDLTTGKYDVTVDVGPTYKTKRQESAESMTQLAQAYPEIMKIAGDLLVKNFDWPGAQQLADRLRKTIPPQLLDNPGEKEIPPQVQQQLQESSQMIEELTKVVNQLTQEKENKVMELESKERIALENNTTKLTIEAMKHEMGAMHLVLKEELSSITNRLNLLGVNQPVDESNESGTINNIDSVGASVA